MLQKTNSKSLQQRIKANHDCPDRTDYFIPYISSRSRIDTAPKMTHQRAVQTSIGWVEGLREFFSLKHIRECEQVLRL